MNKQLLFIFPLLLCTACESLPSWMGGAEKAVARLPGERLDVLQSNANLEADASLAQTAFNIPPAALNENWSQSTGLFTAQNANIKLAGDLTLRENVSIGDGHAFSHSLVPRPMVANGRVFAMDAKGYISAHDATHINQTLWVSAALSNDNEVMGGGLALDGGKLYAVSGLGRIVALDANTGAEIWHRDLGIPLRSAPRVSEGKLYVISIDSQLFALDVANGTSVWSHRGIGETAGLMNNVSPAMIGDLVIAPYASGELYALKKETGDEVWRASLAQAKRTEATAVFSGIGGDPVIDDVAVFAVSSSGLFSAFNSLNGQSIWEKKVASINTPWLAGEYLFLMSEDNQLSAIAKYDGRVRWTLSLPRFKDDVHQLYPIVWRGPVMTDGKLLLINAEGEMKIIDATNGTELLTLSIAEGVSTVPVVASGKLFLVGNDATLYSYQ